MNPPTQSLLKSLEDCEAEAEANATKRYPSTASPICTGLWRESQYGYQAGHRACFDKLAPALKVAIDELELCAEDTETHDGIRACKEAIDEIRSLLGGGEEGEK